jgi:hypothetical protein
MELNTPTGIHPRFHVELLRRASSDPLPSQQRDDEQPPPILEEQLGGEEGGEEYAVEEILRAKTTKRGRGVSRKALVKWQGYAEPTWEPIGAVQDTEALDRYEARWGPIQEHDGPPLPQSRADLAAEAKRSPKKKVRFRFS